MAFIEDNGYGRPEFWLSLGWMTVNESASGGWQAPLYWMKHEGAWWNFTLSGFRPVDESEPVTHVSYFEADAYANWAGARLATEFEWERAALDCPVEGNFVEDEKFHPRALVTSGVDKHLHQMFGDVWEWTRSAYLSRLSGGAGRTGRIQRQVHVQPVRPTRRFVRHLAQSYSPKLSQFLPTGKTLAVYRDQARARSTMNR